MTPPRCSGNRRCPTCHRRTGRLIGRPFWPILTTSCGRKEGATEMTVDGADRQAALGPSSFPGRRRAVSSALLPLLALIVPSIAGALAPEGSAAFVLAGIPLIVIAIASEQRMPWERSLIRRDLPERESWLPATYIGLGFLIGDFQASSAWDVIVDKSGLIAFILAFALVSEGLSRSGIFHFLAFRIAERCDGSTGRLLFYLFIMASVLTAFTSNDIVVLALTPIVISVCHQARIRNVRLILLATFIAANTLSMALLIGSPTNIILAEAMRINGLSYTLLMAVPAIFAFVVTFLVISRVVGRVEAAHSNMLGGRKVTSRLGRAIENSLLRWDYSETYTVPQFNSYHRVTPRMNRWIKLFAFAVVALLTASVLEASLWFAALPIAVLAIAVSALDRDRASPESRRTFREEAAAVGDLSRAMPWGILFFGLSFFVVAAAFSGTEFFQSEVVDRLNDTMAGGGPLIGIGSIGGTGLVVNLFNDLPAAALLAETLPVLSFDTDLDRAAATIGVMAGLNIGTYLTPTGALAGLIWFRVMRREADRSAKELGAVGTRGRVQTPSRGDLLRFGGIVFVSVTIVLGLIVYGLVALVAYLVSDVDSAPLFGNEAWGFPTAALGLTLAGASVVLFRRELRRRNVVIAHLRDAFVFLNRFSAWALRHPIAYGAAVVGSVLLVAATALYWAERYHAQLYGTEAKFTGLKGYLSWLVAFMGSGYEQELFPVSLLGILMCGLLPLLGIALIVRILRAPVDSSKDQLRARLARGEASSDRLVVIAHPGRDEFLVELLLAHSDRFVVVLSVGSGSDDALRKLVRQEERLFVDEIDMDRVQEAIDEFRVLDAREVLLLSDGTPESDYQNMRFLGALDDCAHLSPHRLVPGSERAPHVLFECANGEMQRLLRRSISHELAGRVCVVTIGEATGDYLATDVIADLRRVEQVYRFDGGDERPEGLRVRSLGDQGIGLSLHELTTLGRVEVDRFRARIRRSSEDTSNRVHTSALRDELELSVGRAAAEAGLRPSQVVGLEVSIGPSSMLMGIPTAALSAQTETARRVVVVAGRSDEEHHEPVRGAGEERVHVVNLTASSQAFILALLRWSSGGALSVTLHVAKEDQVPSGISGSPQVSVVRTADAEQMVGHLTGELPTSIQAGDKVYVFSAQGRTSSHGLDALRLVRSLDTSLAEGLSLSPDNQRVRPGVRQEDVYIAVESRDASTRFLFEQMFVDKIIDTDQPRENMLRNFVEFHYRLPAEQQLPVGHSTAAFRLAVECAEYFRHGSLFAAKDEVAGAEVVSGMDFDSACLAVRTQSEPPQQMLAVASFSLADDGASLDAELRFPDVGYTLAEDDRVFLVSII